MTSPSGCTRKPPPTVRATSSTRRPPYAHFLPELAQTFPEAKFIALWRNPLAVVASIVETFCGGRWEPDRYPLSLYAALAALVESTQQHPDRVWSVRFEDLASADRRCVAGADGLSRSRVRPRVARGLQPGDPVRPARRQGRRGPVLGAERGAADASGSRRSTTRCAGRGAAATSIGSGRSASRMMGYDHAQLQQELDCDDRSGQPASPGTRCARPSRSHGACCVHDGDLRGEQTNTPQTPAAPPSAVVPETAREAGG